MAASEAEKGQRERERRERDRAGTWHRIQNLWDHDRGLLHAHLIDKGVEHEDDRNGILSATNFRVTCSYDPGRRDSLAGFRRYYLTAIDSEIIDRWRKQGQRFVRCDDDKLIALSARLPASPSPEDLVIAGEDRAARKALLERLRLAIRSLPWRQKSALMLWLEEPQPKASEIALALRTTEAAVYQLLSRARSVVQKILLGESDIDA